MPIKFARRPKLLLPVYNAYIKDIYSRILTFLAIAIYMINVWLWHRITAVSIVALSPFKFDIITLGLIFLLINLGIALPLHRKDIKIKIAIYLGTVIVELYILVYIMYTIISSEGL